MVVLGCSSGGRVCLAPAWSGGAGRWCGGCWGGKGWVCRESKSGSKQLASMQQDKYKTMHAHISTRTYIYTSHTYIYTSMHAQKHTCIHTYIHTCPHDVAGAPTSPTSARCAARRCNLLGLCSLHASLVALAACRHAGSFPIRRGTEQVLFDFGPWSRRAIRPRLRISGQSPALSQDPESATVWEVGGQRGAPSST